MLVNAVFEGGGVKGIGLAGAVAETEKRGFKFHRVAGTSSGSVVASLIAAGYSGEQMRTIIMDTPFSTFMKRAPIFNAKVVGPAVRLLLKKGLYSGEALEQWISALLLARGVRTFGDLKPGQLQIIASDITDGKLLVLPDDIAQYGIEPRSFSVAKAVRMSTSIPYFFDPVMIRRRQPRAKGESFASQFAYIVDGGLLSNFPLWLFDQAQEQVSEKLVPTFGYQLVGKAEHAGNPIRGPITMLQAMFATMLSAHDERYIEDHYRYRTIKIPALGVGTTEFTIPPEKSLKLYESGIDAASRYFDQWTLSHYKTQFEHYIKLRNKNLA